jgi:predicted MFS family arabinose efflux permease
MTEVDTLSRQDVVSRHDVLRLVRLLIETSAVQALATLAVLSVPTLTPMVARAIGVPTSYVGYQVAIVYLAAMLASLCAGIFIGRFGACRTGQIAMLLNAVGCLVASRPSIGAIALGSVVIGCGYGLTNPAASELLMRHGPPDRRNLIFSLKQTGVPLGGMIAGLVAPSIAIGFGWQAVLWSVAGCSLLVAAASQLGRAALDRHRDRSPGSTALPLRALAAVMTRPALRWLALSSLCYSGIQLCVVAFLVVLLVEDLQYDLVTAGAILGLVQITGVVSRILWGYLADRLHDGLIVLIGLGLIMAMAATVVALSPALPAWVPVAMFIVLGPSAVGWTGSTCRRWRASVRRDRSERQPARRCSSPSPACWSDRRCFPSPTTSSAAMSAATCCWSGLPWPASPCWSRSGVGRRAAAILLTPRRITRRFDDSRTAAGGVQTPAS